MQLIESLTALSNLATAIGLGVTAYQLLITRKQNVTTFEDSLAAQYRQVASTLPLEALLGEPLDEATHKANLPYFYRYFDLCNEQVFLNKHGRISGATWTFWEDGIRTNLNRPAFARAWSEIARRAKDDFDELRVIYPPGTQYALPDPVPSLDVRG